MASSESALIRLEEVIKDYHLGEIDLRVLKGVSLSIYDGEFVAIMGASGSGKSTLMNILGCLDRPTSGRYLLDGVDVSELDKKTLAGIRNQKLGFVFQGFNLLARTTALENTALPTLYTKRAKEQRVAIARALVNGPSILLADEPTGNLDSRTSVEIMDVLQGLNDRGLTIVMVTHEPDIAQFAKRIVVFRDGRIRRDDTVRDRPKA